MPLSWLEGTLPVSAKCVVCDRNCGSVRRLQDWRCLWCKAIVSLRTNHARTHARTHSRTHTHTNKHTHTYTHTYSHTHTLYTCMHTHIHRHSHTYMNIYELTLVLW